MHYIFILFLLLISAPTLAKQKLVFATHTRPPLSLYLKEVMQEALSPYAITVEVIEMPGSRVIAQVNNGEVDGDLCRVKNFTEISDDDTSNYLRVNEAMVLTEIVMITLANKKIIRPITRESINLGKVAFQRGSKTIRLHVDEQNRVALSTSLQVLEMVANNRVDAAIMFESVAQDLLSNSPELNEQLLIQRPALTAFHLYAYLNKKHADLVPKLEFSLRDLKKNGFLEKTAAKYHVIPAAL
mgnify:CR=1 FL=1